MTEGLPSEMTAARDVRSAPLVTGSRGVRLARAVGIDDVGRALRDFATYLPTQAIPAIAGFLVLPILARKLPPNSIGILAIAQTLITLGWTAAGSWLTVSIIRELPGYRAAGNVAGFARTLAHALGVSALALAGFSLLLGLASLVSTGIASNLGLIIAGTLGLTLQNFAVTLFAADLKPRRYAVTEVLARTGGICLGVFLVFDGYGVHGYLTGLAAASLAVGIVGLLLAWPRSHVSPVNDGRGVKEWAHYGIPASAAALAMWGLFFVDRYILAAFRSADAVGVYSVGAIVGDKAISIPTLAFFTGAAPLLVTAFEHQGRQEVEKLMRAYSRVMLLIGIPTLAFLIGNAGILVPLLAGKHYYYAAAPVISLVAAGSLIYSLALIGNTGLIVAKRALPLISAAIVGLVVNVAANLILIPHFGIKGAAAATPIGMAAYLASVQIWSRHHVTWRFPFSTLGRACIAAGAGLAISYELERLTNSTAGDLALACFGGGAVYVLVLVLLGERRSSTRRSA